MGMHLAACSAGSGVRKSTLHRHATSSTETAATYRSAKERSCKGLLKDCINTDVACEGDVGEQGPIIPPKPLSTPGGVPANKPAPATGLEPGWKLPPWKLLPPKENTPPGLLPARPPCAGCVGVNCCWRRWSMKAVGLGACVPGAPTAVEALPALRLASVPPLLPPPLTPPTPPPFAPSIP